MHTLTPVGMALDPGVEGGLRLFEQNHVAVSGLLGGGESQLAGNGVEGCGHGHENLLVDERGAGHFEIPGIAQVLQVKLRRLDGGEFLHARSRAPGEQGAGAVDAGMRQPGFRRRDQAAGIFDAALLGQAADYLSGVRVPGRGNPSRRGDKATTGGAARPALHQR